MKIRIRLLITFALSTGVFQANAANWIVVDDFSDDVVSWTIGSHNYAVEANGQFTLGAT